MIRIEPTFEPPPEAPADPTAPRKIATLGEAERLVLQLMDVMDALLAIVEEETKLVRNGRADTAARLQAAKSDLARHYVGSIAALRANHDYLGHAMPDALAALHRRHDTFRALLQINLTVLAVAKAVAEGQEFAPTERRVIGEGVGTARRRLPIARGWPGPTLRPPPRQPAEPPSASGHRSC